MNNVEFAFMPSNSGKRSYQNHRNLKFQPLSRSFSRMREYYSMGAGESVSIMSCKTKCSLSGHPNAGLKFGNQCSCGSFNELDPLYKVPDVISDQCNLSCQEGEG